MTVSILQSLAMLPSGERGQALDLASLAAHLKARIGTPEEDKRNARHALRDRLYRDGGDADMAAVIDLVFDDPVVRAKRKAFVPYAKFSNSLKRIVNELSTVYAEPARRTVADPASQVTYDALLANVAFDEQMDVVNQMLNLHRALIVGPRIRKDADGLNPELVIDVVTPSAARCITDPTDTTHVLGWLVSIDMPLARNPWAPTRPKWLLWTEHECLYLDETFTPITGSDKEHGLGMNRWVPISYSAATVPGFWPGCEGDDLVAAQITIWLASILMLKETKSNTKQPLIQGDTSTMARGQVADSDVAIEAPEGVGVTTIDVGTDPGIFIKAADHALQRAGNNYGLSMSALTHEGTQSAEARELMLAPIRERRRKQIKIFRRFEARLVKVIAAVISSDAPEFAFDPAGFRIDFGETQVLLGEKDRLEIFKEKRRMGLTNTVACMMSEDPDLDASTAVEELAHNIAIETSRNEMMRPMEAISGSPQSGVEDVMPPEGATGSPPSLPASDSTEPQ